MGNPEDAVKQKLEIKWIEAKRLVHWSKEELGLDVDDECPSGWEDQCIDNALDLYKRLSPSDQASMKATFQTYEPAWKVKAVEQAMKREQQWVAARDGKLQNLHHHQKQQQRQQRHQHSPVPSSVPSTAPSSSQTIMTTTTTEKETVVYRERTTKFHDDGAVSVIDQEDDPPEITKTTSTTAEESFPAARPAVACSNVTPESAAEQASPATSGVAASWDKHLRVHPQAATKPVRVVTCYCDIL